ncbi:hypothetical protein D3C74_394980 [compost metagenome]
MTINHTNEDGSYVKMYLLLPMILTAFERDKLVAKEAFKTSRPYIALIDAAIKKVETDLKEVRRKFRILGIKVYEEKRTELGIQASYLCRGYHHDFNMLWSVIAAESSVLMEKYLGIDIRMYIDPTVPGSHLNSYSLPSEMKQDH